MRAISESAMRKCISNLHQLANISSAKDLPVDLESLARRVGVVALEPADLTVDGYVGTTRDGSVVIRYRRSNPYYRNRFTIAHEIAHVLIADLTNTPISERKARTGFDREELVANRLAAEMLMPEFILAQLLQLKIPSWGTVQSLRKLFDVSAYALLRRMTEISGVVAFFARFDTERLDLKRWRLCHATSVPRVCFTRPLQELISKVMRDAESTSFSATAFVDDDSIDIPCQLRLADQRFTGDSWAYGWTQL